MTLNHYPLEHDVSKRSGLPLSIKESLLESTRSEWQNHPCFGGKASFFMSIHRELLEGSAQLTGGIEQLLDVRHGEIHAAVKQMNLIPFASNLIRYAHHHHEMEDRNYFPQMCLKYPKLDQGFSLLESDHNTVDAALVDTQQALKALEGVAVTRDQLAKLYLGSKKLKNILARHIWDEEEIIIPIFLEQS